MYRLLIVDDEPFMRAYIRNNLTAFHPEWECGGEAEDGQDALDALDRGETFDLILTDIKMPVMDGLELVRRVSERGIRTRMIILSGYDEFALAKEAIRYGVEDYLLKPIVKEELIATLEKTKLRLDADKADRQYRSSLLALSETSREQVARQFLSALAADNDAETKALYPILFRLKLSLIEAEGAILLLALDEGELLGRSASPSEATLFRYILHQTATELAGGDIGGTVFFDREQRTAVLVPGDGAADVRAKCERLYRELSSAMLGMTGIGLWGAAGSCEMDVLQVAASYRKARQTLQFRLFRNEACLIGEDQTDADKDKVQLLDKDALDIHAALLNGQDDELYAALKTFGTRNGINDSRTIARFGVDLLNRLAAFSKESADTWASGAWIALRDVANAPDIRRPEDVVFALRRMLQRVQTASSPAAAPDEEHEIVARAKRYIGEHYAEPLSLALVAETIGVSPGYLSSLFHKNAGESYIKYVTRIRMENAAALLRGKPPEKVYDVAEKVGYVSVKHFSYVFKQHYGIPPGEYQEKALE